jgi:hypothetical protein
VPRTGKSRQSKPYDVTLKHLVEVRPQDALALLDVGENVNVRIVDADLATVVPEADKVLHVRSRGRRFIVHLEFQVSRDRNLLGRVFSYNALLYRRHGLPVLSAVVVLRPAADDGYTGVFEIPLPGDLRHRFEYKVIRVWELPLATVLSGGPGILPLAPLCSEAGDDPAPVIDQMKSRLEKTKVDADLQKTVWAATYFLMGLRYDKKHTAQLLEGVRGMRESVTFVATLAEEARKMLLRIGRKRFGPASAETVAALEAIEDPENLEALGERLLDVSSWTELLRKPAGRRSNGKKKN